MLVLLYFSGAAGVGFSDLSSWVRPKMRNNLRRTLRVLVERDMAHQDDSTYYIPRPGERYVERERLSSQSNDEPTLGFYATTAELDVR